MLQPFVFLTEIRISPTKPYGKGSKRKQDELDEDEDDYDEAERPTWVEALTQEITDDEAPEEDPDYEVDDETNCCSSLYCILYYSCMSFYFFLFLAQHCRDGE